MSNARRLVEWPSRPRPRLPGLLSASGMDYPRAEPYLSEEKRSWERGSPVPALSVAETTAAYYPRHPKETVLYGAVAEQLETVLSRQEFRGRVVPRFVERELRSYLECGILARGFLRVRCDVCR